MKKLVIAMILVFGQVSFASEGCKVYSRDLIELDKSGQSRFKEQNVSNERIQHLEVFRNALQAKGYVFEESEMKADVRIRSFGAFYYEQSMCVSGHVEMVDIKTGEVGIFVEDNCSLLAAMFEVGKSSVLKKALAKIPECY